jgi:hypothetical protein
MFCVFAFIIGIIVVAAIRYTIEESNIGLISDNVGFETDDTEPNKIVAATADPYPLLLEVSPY